MGFFKPFINIYFITEKSKKMPIIKPSHYLGQTGTLNVEAIQKIDPVSQFSETQASAIVNFNFHDSFSDDNLILKFIFSKNVDKKWVLTSIESVQGVGSEGLSDWVRKQ